MEALKEKDGMYADRIWEQIDYVRLKGISSKILQHMARVRNVSDQSQARRWVMELLQNAQDVSYPGRQVRVRIGLEEDRLIFSHNGMPFRIKDILSMINQVSSKDPNGENVGKFGTGFVTTFQLSEKVQVESVLSEEGLPYKPFSVTLDRTGTEDEAIQRAIVRAMKELEEVDRRPPKDDFDPDEYNTSFVYQLSGRESKKAALTGMEDLRHSVFHILLFSGKVAEIRLEYRMGDRQESLCYRRLKDEPWMGGEGAGALRCLSFVTARESGAAPGILEEEFSSLIYLREGEVTIAAGWREGTGFAPVSGFTPRLFVKFPLIGAEDFPFPLVVNCDRFQMNEPRSGITLVDNPVSRDAPVNKEYIRQAVSMYESFLNQAAEKDRRGFVNLLSIPAWRDDPEHSETWVRKNIYKALYRIISNASFLENRGKEYRLNHPFARLIQEPDEKMRNRLQGLLEELPNCYIPDGGEDWYDALQNYPLEEGKIWSLEKLLQQAETLVRSVKEPLPWLLKLCGLGLSRPETAVGIRTGQLRVLPNQAEGIQGRLYCANELQRDPGIPEILKDVSEQLDRLDSAEGEEKLAIRGRLLHQEFGALAITETGTFEVARLEAYIIRRSSREYRVSDFGARSAVYSEAWKRAWLLLLSCGPDREMYQLCRNFYPEELPEYEPCPGERRDSLWRSCYVSVLEQITERVSSCGTLNVLTERYFGEEEDAIGWLNRLIPKGQEYLREFSFKCIFPDQEGRLKGFQWIRADGTPDEVLKEIAFVFRGEDRECNFYAKVLDRRLHADRLSPGRLNEEEVAMVLNRTLQQILASRLLADTPMEYQSACSRLLAWMDENTEAAGRLFPAFAGEQDKVRLMTPGAVVELQKGKRRMEQMLREAGVGSLEELGDHLKALEEKMRYYDGLGQGRIGAEGAGSGGWYFADDADVFFDGSLLACDERERADILRAIGSGGERYALRRVKEYCLEKGAELLSEKDGEIVLETPEAGIVITYGDRGSYHQAGWDIRVDAGGETYYLEVKTHTLSSGVFSQLALSREQMRLACRERERYIVLHVAYDRKAGEGVECRAFRDPAGCFGAGSLDCIADRFVFLF